MKILSSMMTVVVSLGIFAACGEEEETLSTTEAAYHSAGAAAASRRARIRRQINQGVELTGLPKQRSFKVEIDFAGELIDGLRKDRKYRLFVSASRDDEKAIWTEKSIGVNLDVDNQSLTFDLPASSLLQAWGAYPDSGKDYQEFNVHFKLMARKKNPLALLHHDISVESKVNLADFAEQDFETKNEFMKVRIANPMLQNSDAGVGSRVGDFNIEVTPSDSLLAEAKGLAEIEFLAKICVPGGTEFWIGCQENLPALKLDVDSDTYKGGLKRLYIDELVQENRLDYSLKLIPVVAKNRGHKEIGSPMYISLAELVGTDFDHKILRNGSFEVRLAKIKSKDDSAVELVRDR